MKTTAGSGRISVNRKVRHEYEIQTKYEAGVLLLGWEVKSLRAGRAQLGEGHVVIRRGEAYLLNAHISPLPTVSTHFVSDPTRTRKLLLNRIELNRLMGHVEQKGFTIVPLSFYWKNNHVKLEIALAKGLKQHDKRALEKDRDWARQKEQLFKRSVK